MAADLRFFIAGIMQGSKDNGAHPQEYRAEITSAVSDAFPGAEIYNPEEHYPVDGEYNPQQARDAFFDIMENCGYADVLIAYVPEASMGAAVELWNAFNTGAYILCITPLGENWTILSLSDYIVKDMKEFGKFASSGKLKKAIGEKVGFSD